MAPHLFQTLTVTQMRTTAAFVTGVTSERSWGGRDRPAHHRPLHPTCSHSASFTHTSPTGMEPHRSARTAGGGRGLFCAAHTAANSRRILPAFVWIVALVSGSRSRTYPPNEGEYGGDAATRHAEGGHAGERPGTVAQVCTAQLQHWNTERLHCRFWVFSVEKLCQREPPPRLSLPPPLLW